MFLRVGGKNMATPEGRFSSNDLRRVAIAPKRIIEAFAG
jgi:hypothetical protein